MSFDVDPQKDTGFIANWKQDYYEAQDIFLNNLSHSPFHWRQVVVVIFSAIGSLFFVVGFFPIFSWTARLLKIEESEQAQQVTEATGSFFSSQSTGEVKGVISKNASISVPKHAFGKAQWEQYYGAVEDVPIPLEMTKRPEFRDSNFLLVLIPETVDGVPLSVNHLNELTAHPKANGKASITHYHDELTDIPREILNGTKESHWVLISKDILKNSENRLYGDQKQLADDKHLEIPEFRDVMIARRMEYTKSGTKFSNKLAICRTIKAEEVADDEDDLWMDSALVVGPFNGNQLEVTALRYRVWHLRAEKNHGVLGAVVSPK